MESWQEKLYQASFRGIPFFTDSTNLQTGLGVKVTEFPNFEAEPQIKQLGRKIKKHNIEGTLFSNEDGDFQEKRDSLFEAFRFPGPGTLIHEYFGELEVLVSCNTIKQTYEDGSTCKFTFCCYELPPEIKKYNVSQKSLVDKANSTAKNSLKNSIKDGIYISPLDNNSFVNSIRNGTNKIKNVFRAAKSNVDFLTYNINSLKNSFDFKNTLGGIENSIFSLEDSLNEFINLPSQTIEVLQGVIDRISNLQSDNNSKKAAILNNLSNVGDTTFNTFSRVFDSVFFSNAIDKLIDVELEYSSDINSIFDLFDSKCEGLINLEDGDYKLNLMSLNSALFKLRLEFLNSTQKQKTIEVKNEVPLSVVCWEHNVFLQNEKIMQQNKYYGNPLFFKGSLKIDDV